MKSARKIDQRLRESELRLKLALRAAQIGVWDWNLLTGEMEHSVRARAVFGFSPTETIDLQKLRAITHPEDLPHTHAQSLRAFDPEVRDKSSYEYRILRADTGALRWVIAHGEAMFRTIDGKSTAVRYLGTVQDITERRRVEDALAESEMTQRLAIEAAGMAVWAVDLRTQAVHSSPTVNEMFGFPAEAQPALEDLHSRYLPGERERIQEAGRQAVERGETQFEAEFRVRGADGLARWLMLQGRGAVFGRQRARARAGSADGH